MSIVRRETQPSRLSLLLFSLGAVLCAVFIGYDFWTTQRGNVLSPVQGPKLALLAGRGAAPQESFGVLPDDASPPVFPAASAGSSDPAEDFMARVTVLEERVRPAGKGRWIRRQLVREPAGRSLFVVDETWRANAAQTTLHLLSREIFSASQIMIRVADRTKAGDLDAALSARSLRISGEIAPGVFVAQLPAADPDAVDRALASVSDLVPRAERDGLGFGAASSPNDPYFPQQWNLLNSGQSSGEVKGKAGVDIGASALWTRLKNKATNVSIAVLDTGLRFDHPDLKSVVSMGYDFVNNDSNASDDHGHGTGVAGVLFSSSNNSNGIAGILPGARLIAAKVLDKDKKGLTSQLIAGLAYARTNGATVMNLSLVGYTPPGKNTNEDSLLSQELGRCESNGIVLCISAGNKGTDNDQTPDYPSCHTNANIIAVGNHDRTGARWSGVADPSNFGAKSVDLFAPGREIISPDLARSYGDYSLWTGTSVATPHATAAAAAVKAVRPLWSAHDVKAAIMNSAIRSTELSNLCLSGGRLAASKAVDYALKRPAGSQSIPPFARTNNVPVGMVLTFTNNTSTAGLPVRFSLVSGPVKIKGNKATITGVGPVAVRATQAGNTNFNPAPSLTNIFTAVK